MIITFRFHHSDRDYSIIRWNLFHLSNRGCSIIRWNSFFCHKVTSSILHHDVEHITIPLKRKKSPSFPSSPLFLSSHLSSFSLSSSFPILTSFSSSPSLSFLISHFSFYRLSHLSFPFDLHQAENRIGWHESKKVLVSSFCHAFVTDIQKIGITFALEKGEIVKG